MPLGPENQVSCLQPIAHLFFLFEGPETYGQQSKYGSRDETADSSLRPEQISSAARSPIGLVATSCGVEADAVHRFTSVLPQPPWHYQPLMLEICRTCWHQHSTVLGQKLELSVVV